MQIPSFERYSREFQAEPAPLLRKDGPAKKGRSNVHRHRLVGQSQFVLNMTRVLGQGHFFGGTKGWPSGYDALPRFRQAAVTPLAAC